MVTFSGALSNRPNRNDPLDRFHVPRPCPKGKPAYWVSGQRQSRRLCYSLRSVSSCFRVCFMPPLKWIHPPFYIVFGSVAFPEGPQERYVHGLIGCIVSYFLVIGGELLLIEKPLLSPPGMLGCSDENKDFSGTPKQKREIRGEGLSQLWPSRNTRPIGIPLTHGLAGQKENP